MVRKRRNRWREFKEINLRNQEYEEKVDVKMGLGIKYVMLYLRLSVNKRAIYINQINKKRFLAVSVNFKKKVADNSCVFYLLSHSKSTFRGTNQ